jgi:oligogalacturonide lyase
MKLKLPSEHRIITDEKTGRSIRQVTQAQCINHHPFFLIPAYDSSMRFLYFVSHRSGAAQVFVQDWQEDCIYQLSDVIELNEWSVHPADNLVYYIADGCAMRTDALTGETQVLLDAKQAAALTKGKTAAINPGTTPITPGTTALSRNGRFWAIRMVRDEGYSVLVYDSHLGTWAKENTAPMISHMQFCPDDDNLLFCAGPLTDRVWVLDRREGKARRIFERNAAEKQWITHESLIPGTFELCLVDWPRGLLAVNALTGSVRRIASFNAWHAISDSKGSKIVTDTKFPDIGLMLCDTKGGGLQTLCYPEASNQGDHWAGPFPYDNGPISVNAPQHTHPHPSFSPDGSKVVYTSDKSGFAQVFEIELPK